jgi:hypothetical protein
MMITMNNLRQHQSLHRSLLSPLPRPLVVVDFGRF